MMIYIDNLTKFEFVFKKHLLLMLLPSSNWPQEQTLIQMINYITLKKYNNIFVILCFLMMQEYMLLLFAL
jgi:hypothetical protein